MQPSPGLYVLKWAIPAQSALNNRSGFLVPFLLSTTKHTFSLQRYKPVIISPVTAICKDTNAVSRELYLRIHI